MSDTAISTTTTSTTTSSTRTRFSAEELLTTQPGLTALVADGVLCHGGLDADESYVSPRMLHRGPAIEAWQHQHSTATGTPVLDIGLDQFGAHYPNVAQTHVLLDAGVRDPITATLTRIGTVEGFGSFLRYSTVPDLQRFVAEDLSATALGHLESGLIEAHARDEAGSDDGTAGHDRMWFAARDIAFEHPVTEDQRALMLKRMGISSPGGTIDVAALRATAMANRALPAVIDFDFESLIERLLRLLLIEISAFHTFTWAEAVLSDTTRVAGDGAAARLVAAIRADETPHVDYIRTALSELSVRTIIGTDGSQHDGGEVVATLWDRAVQDGRGARRYQLLDLMWREVRQSVAGRRNAEELLARFDQAGTSTRDADGRWTDPTVAELAA